MNFVSSGWDRKRNYGVNRTNPEHRIHGIADYRGILHSKQVPALCITRRGETDGHGKNADGHGFVLQKY